MMPIIAFSCLTRDRLRRKVSLVTHEIALVSDFDSAEPSAELADEFDEAPMTVRIPVETVAQLFAAKVAEYSVEV